MTSVRVYRYEDNKTYPILVKIHGAGYHRIVEMLGSEVNAYNDRVSRLCPRCGRIHDCPPVDVEAIKRDLAAEMAAEIDRQVLEMMRK